MKGNRPSHETVDRGSQGLIFTGAYFLAMLLLYVGERLVFENTSARLVLAVLAGLLIALAIGGRVFRISRIKKQAEPIVERRILLTYLVGVAALVLYFGQIDVVMEWLRAGALTEPKLADRYATVMAAAWVVVWLCAALPLVFLEISYAPMDTARTVELSRISRSARSGLVIAMSASTVFALNYVAKELNEKVDLSYFKTTRASESSLKMVNNLTAPFEVILFFPSNNDVLEELEGYFGDLGSASKQFRVRKVDHVLEPKLAKELGASDNGTVVFKHKERNRQLVIGQKMERAKSKLAKLDSEFQNAFLHLARSQKIAYLTVGHEERAQKLEEQPDGEKIDDLREVLRRLNYWVKDLGVAQGLASEIPSDATFVLIAGPRKDFMPGEIEALKAYLRRGGRLLVLLDPEAGVSLDGLLNPFGLKYHATPLSVAQPLARRTFTKADRHIIVTNRFGVHTSVNTLSRNSNQLALVLLGSGYLTEMPPSEPAKPQVRFTVHAMPFSWNDANGNFEFDDGSETRKDYELAAAVTMASSNESKPSDAKAKPGEQGENEMRMIVVADSDVASDGLLFSRALGNRYLLADAIKWLGGEEQFIGETTSEEDVRIAHTRKEDEKWFYLTIFGVPALVLGAGLIYTQRRRKQR